MPAAQSQQDTFCDVQSLPFPPPGTVGLAAEARFVFFTPFRQHALDGSPQQQSP